MAARRKRRKQPEEEHANHERWMVSYSDMLTVMMGLFIVLYAMSQVDMQKFDALRDSLAASFGNQAILTGSSGVLESSDDVGKDQQDQTPADAFDPVTADAGLGGASATAATPPAVSPAIAAAAQAEAQRLEGIEQQIEKQLAAAGLSGVVQMTITERGLVIGLVADDVFFAPASADLTPTALRVLDAIAPTVVALTDEISVEGHANVLPVSGKYPTNWELSADRATQVLRHFVETDGLAPGRVDAVGFGDARPIAAGTDAESLAMNRRVDIVVLSSAPEQVRALVPGFVAQDQGK
ncbi:MAG TPA: flagellar motor protein MotB [Cellulomonas sp.]